MQRFLIDGPCDGDIVNSDRFALYYRESDQQLTERRPTSGAWGTYELGRDHFYHWQGWVDVPAS